MRGASAPYLPVALGSALGALARYGLSSAAAGLASPGASVWPWGTLAANVLGSFLIGYLAARLAGEEGRDDALRQFALAGFCGGFTTFSLFGLETVQFLAAGETGIALAYVGSSLVLWLAGVAAGFALGVRRPGR